MTKRADAIAGHLVGAGKALVVLLLCLTSATAPAADRGPIRPADDDRCPVCGMFAAKHPDFAARVTFSDGAGFTFDGAKDMFRFLFDVARYAPGRSRSDVGQILVTEYYELVGIDARTALFVTGSDVHGPMGAELIPFATREDAEAFRSDHRGTAVLTFDGVDFDTLRELAATR
ncbi:MAG TPA: nitrous oxide reductase accessory protein NosL [Candidatus Sulfomarinibacteraceae bacterium]|nr:nitrous oxide reductase accessory protein NosL [Candidatus Sulfomarinibacteraceae bacterium]